jgi:hypothetical protein
VIPANTDELRTLLINIKRQVAETLRNVVDVVGKYAAHCLPGEARNSVRGFILSLPSRWVCFVLHVMINFLFLISFAQASINNRFKTPEGPIDASALASDSTLKETQKVLTLATESSAMLKGIQEVVEASVGAPSSKTTGTETMLNGSTAHPMKRSKGKTDSAMDISDDEDQHFEEAREESAH